MRYREAALKGGRCDHARTFDKVLDFNVGVWGGKGGVEMRRLAECGFCGLGAECF